MSLNLPTQAVVVRFAFGARGQGHRNCRRDASCSPRLSILQCAPLTRSSSSSYAIPRSIRIRAILPALLPRGLPPDFGSDPNDPAGFSAMVDAGSAVCQMLSAYAATACMRRGRYF